MRWRAYASLLVLLAFRAVQARDIELRQFSNVPVGVNFLLGDYVYTTGGLAIDPALPTTDPKLQTSSAVLAYARALDLSGLSGRFDVIVPNTRLSGTAPTTSS
jgi:hypothetical protein